MEHFKFDLLNHFAMKCQMVRFKHSVFSHEHRNNPSVNLENKETWRQWNEISFWKIFLCVSYIQYSISNPESSQSKHNDWLNRMKQWIRWQIFILFCFDEIFVLDDIFYLFFAFTKSIVFAIGQRPKMIFVSEAAKGNQKWATFRCQSPIGKSIKQRKFIPIRLLFLFIIILR